MRTKSHEHPSVSLLKSVYQHCGEGFINTRFLPSAKNHFIPLKVINYISKILEINKDQNAYFGVATRINGDGSKNGIIQIPVLWLDLDLYKLTDKEKEESRQRYKEFPLKTAFAIDSGGGRYLLWMLKEPASREEIPEVETRLKWLASYFHGDMSATDASRILRIPGSLNYKYQHTPPVIIKSFHPERQYNLDDFEILPQVEERPNGEERPYRQETNERLNQIMECEFLTHCDRDRMSLSEPEWYAMISILARETGGPQLIHSLSKGYPKYSLQETDKKILHAINDTGPATCERIKRELFDCGKDCGVKSPAVLFFVNRQDLNSSEINETTGNQVNNKHHFSLIQAKDILSIEEPETDWLWEGILPMGGIEFSNS